MVLNPYQKIISAVLFAGMVICISSCNTTRRIKDGQYLLEKTEIRGHKNTGIPLEAYQSFERQQPNRKFFKVWPFFVAWYNMFNDSVILAKKEARNIRYDEKNAERIHKNNIKNEERAKKGKKSKEPKLLNKEEKTWRENFRDIGEAPVILDSSLIEQTALQINKYLFSKGFFNNQVSFNVKTNKKNWLGNTVKKKAYVTYYLLPATPYKIQNLYYEVEDDKLKELFYTDTVNSLIKRGDNYDVDVLQSERARLTKLLLNNGYYYFESAYISFLVDSNLAGQNVSIDLRLKKFARTYSSSSDSVIYISHTKYRINEVFVITEQVVGNLRDVYFSDTTRAKNHEALFLHNQPLLFKTSIIADFIKVHKNTWFNRDTAEATFKSLMAMSVFKGVTIQFLPSNEFRNRLDCYIVCTPLNKQSITMETEGINTFGNLGIDGSAIYQNRNMFRGAELIEFKLQGALTAQRQFNTDEQTDFSSFSRIQQIFNTFQFGPELKFSVPRAFFPFSLLPFNNEMAPRTFVKVAFNYQARAEFVREIFSFDYGFNFRSRNRRFRYEVIPFEAYLVKARLFGNFERDLKNLNDAFLLNSFIDHITTLSRFGLTYTSRENPQNYHKPIHYIKWNMMSSGSILRTLYKWSNASVDGMGRYNMFGIPFAHFVKTELEYRLYIPLTPKSKIVYRVSGGLGKTFANLNVLPYEQSFFSGGPNSIRAWRARTLGPGGYDPSLSPTRFDKIGDILLEGNIEYRFHIIKNFYGAFFVDAGNIWRMQKTDDKPNGEFKPDEFYKQIAIGGGYGIRWDLEFIILRLDIATPIKDPKYPEGDRFTYNKKPWRNIVANFGIGYPF